MSTKNYKARQKYYTSTGELCVGVTTVLGVMSKEALYRWHNKMGLDGIDTIKYVDAMANIGTLIHHLVECDIKGVEPVLGDYTPNDVEVAKKSFQKWVEWRSKNDFKVIASEMQIVSDRLQVGGTCDIYAEVNGKKTVLDIKTSKACYSEQRTQVVAYKQLMIENGKEVDECRIIRIGRDENEGFDDILVGGGDLHWKRFLACLMLYRANKDIENTGA